eukprot:1680631-Prymnesium_polylepis.1
MFVVALRRCVLACARALSSKIIEGLQHLDAATAAPSAGRRASTRDSGVHSRKESCRTLAGSPPPPLPAAAFCGQHHRRHRSRSRHHRLS